MEKIIGQTSSYNGGRTRAAAQIRVRSPPVTRNLVTHDLRTDEVSSARQMPRGESGWIYLSVIRQIVPKGRTRFLPRSPLYVSYSASKSVLSRFAGQGGSVGIRGIGIVETVFSETCLITKT